MPKLDDAVIGLVVPLLFLVASIIAVMVIALSNAKEIDTMKRDIKALKHHTNKLHEMIQREQRKRRQISFISNGEKTPK